MADGASRCPRHCLPVELCQVGAGRSEAWQDSGGEEQVEAQIARAGSNEDPRTFRNSRSRSGYPRASIRVRGIVCRARAAGGRDRAATVGERLKNGEAADPARARISGRNLAAASGFVPLLSHVLRVCRRGDRAARSGAGKLAGPAPDRPVPPFPRRWIRSGAMITLQL